MTRCSVCNLLHDPDDHARCANAMRLQIVLGNAGAIWRNREVADDPGESIEEAVQGVCERRGS